MAGSSPEASPTEIMCVTSGGNWPLVRMVPAIEEPRVMASLTSSIAPPITAFEATVFEISSAGTMLTPPAVSVASVRAKREIAT